MLNKSSTTELYLEPRFCFLKIMKMKKCSLSLKLGAYISGSYIISFIICIFVIFYSFKEEED
jgi:hypothetical protein